jgi:hypothetical protein
MRSTNGYSESAKRLDNYNLIKAIVPRFGFALINALVIVL